MSVVADILVWVERAVRLIPVIQKLWKAVESDDPKQTLAAQLEMTRQMREEQAKERFK